ncbi:hydrogenase nickel incorporation protein HypB [Breoghania sp.]|uniref:hydrogenase nickel incorporation protein HypB n=1 Tax=Breoghania sp. TaxID=2065378 RepID=UPI0026340624|nr:hydrogenase nickel incorporation protein HypB [Breoghania sp.]MDJ0931684.1 hydrogenase nickel incorporation protein HypB [Breoghania sp.]
MTMVTASEPKGTGGALPHVRKEGAERQTRTIRLMRGLLDKNDRVAEDLRQTFSENGIACINLMSSPGSGKTSLLEQTIRMLDGRMRVAAVIEGNLETENDADRIRRRGVPAVQITTGVTCHLNGEMVRDALGHLDLGGIDILFIENVGNLICPADFDLGQTANVVLLSLTEGDDKQLKYPQIFRAADLVLFSKADLGLVIEEFNVERAAAAGSNGRRSRCDPLRLRKERRRYGRLDWLVGRNLRQDESAATGLM